MKLATTTFASPHTHIRITILFLGRRTGAQGALQQRLDLVAQQQLQTVRKRRQHARKHIRLVLLVLDLFVFLQVGLVRACAEGNTAKGFALSTILLLLAVEQKCPLQRCHRLLRRVFPNLR